MGRVIFVTGGARSGKSSFAEGLPCGRDDVLYIATAVPFDDEMKERIRLHRERRNPRWTTLEVYSGLAEKIAAHLGSCSVMILDCVTVMVTNLMLENGNTDWDKINPAEVESVEKMIDIEIDELIEAARSFENMVVIVSNEVGMGIVPGNPLSRYFRDIAGRINQKIASAADDVYLTVSGIPVKIKGGR